MFKVELIKLTDKDDLSNTANDDIKVMEKLTGAFWRIVFYLVIPVILHLIE